MSAIPLAPLPEDIAANVEQLGAKQVNLHRCLAHAPELLRAWINFAWVPRVLDALGVPIEEREPPPAE